MRTLVFLGRRAHVLRPCRNPNRRSSLDAARELYASADYRGALAMLDLLSATDPAGRIPSIDLIGAFCLIAPEKTGRRPRWRYAAMITRDPLYRPAEAEVSPRLRPMFTDKRRAVFPRVIQTRYERAKTAFEKVTTKAARRRLHPGLIWLRRSRDHA